MRWTKKHSRNAVAARERKRIERATAEPVWEKPRRVFTPRPGKPDFILRIESKRGERMQISVRRYHGRVLISDGIKSVRQLCRGLELLLTQSASMT